jgi:beta-xylosidase
MGALSKKLNFWIFIMLVSPGAFAQDRPEKVKWGAWDKWGDLGDGTYRNPLLPGDYSDIDCIRVGADYYAISSTFQFSPGMVILHSKDLVNWTIAGHAVNDLTQISAKLGWERMDSYGKGIWAGAIRHHLGKFWIYFGTPDDGYFMTSAKSINGPWAPLVKVLDAKGWDDCCPFWDDNGQGYLVGTNFADGYKIHLFKLTADGKEIIAGSDQVIYQSKGSEASKLYKINGMYYHFFSEVKDDGRVVMIRKAKTIAGPYGPPKQIGHAQKDFHEPNQGGIIDAPDRKWYFLTHHGSGDWSGRNMSLLPVNWVNGWPILGKAGADTIGSMVWADKKPIRSSNKILPQSSDEFNKGKIQPQWEWNYQPRIEKISLKERKGWLRLRAFRPLEKDNLLKAGNTLTQRSMRTVKNESVVKLDLSGMSDGQKCGLTHFGSPLYAAFGVTQKNGKKVLELNLKKIISTGPEIKGNILWLKSTWGLDGLSQYYYSTNGLQFIAFGAPYQLSWGSYRGDRIGLFNYNNDSDSGYIDIDYFRYTY